MVLVADSGSTKTDWMISGELISAQGINPVTMVNEDITARIPAFSNHVVTEVFFYGAGCVDPFSQRVTQVLLQVFPDAAIHVESDLLGAARALFGHQPGIACILGTGSNSCLYDGEKITDNIPPLGYVLGDEGSGAVLGKLFLNKLFKREMPDSISQAFFSWSQLTYSEIIERVYRKAAANRFLASLSPFIHEHLDDPAVSIMVFEHFNAFVRKNILKYHHHDLPISCVGSIAEHYSDVLINTFHANDLQIGEILSRPIERLAAYHGGKDKG